MSSGSLAGAQLDALLTGDWLTRGPLLLSEDLTPRELESSLALENARRFLATLLEAGALPATSDGALAHEALDRLLDILRWGAPDYGARVRAEFRADLREGDVQPVRITRLVLERLGLMERGDGVFLPTVDTAGALGQQRAAWLFARMFRAYFRDFDHARSDPEDPAPEIHRHSAYSLWVIGQVGDAWWQTEDLLRLLLPRTVLAAETRRLTRLGGRAARAPGFRVVPGPLELLLRRFLEILPDYGLLESAPSLGKSTVAYPRYRKTPLFDRFIRFDFGVDPPPRLEVSPLGSLRLLR